MYDIRRAEEWRQTGVLAGSHTLTFVDAGGRINPEIISKLTQAVRPDQPVILICHSGNRSAVLARELVEQFGYTQVYNVSGGISRWIGESRLVVSY